jgi:hypothetical protein
MNNLPNQDPTTLIHFGCISARELIDSGETFYEQASDTRYADIIETIKTTLEELSEYVDEATIAEMLELAENNFNESYESEGCPLELNRDDVLIMQGNGDDPDIFVIKSLYYCWAPACSPCAPGAGYLLDADKKKSGRHHPFQTYCLDASWFEPGKCPYKYYKVGDE